MSLALGFHLLKVGHCVHPECVAQRGGRWRAVDFPALVALLVHPALGPMLFDTGYSERFMAATDPFPERLYRWVTPVSLPQPSLVSQLANHGIAPGDVKHLFISHLHADHVAGLIDYPRARLHAMRAELNAMRRRTRIGALRRGFLRALLPGDVDTRLSFAEDQPRVTLHPSMRAFGEGFDLLGDGSVTGVALPGHTAGQMGLLFRTQADRQVFLVADACWSLDALTLDRPPTWIAAQLFADERSYLDTFRRLQQLRQARNDLLLVPSHCESTWRRMRDEGR